MLQALQCSADLTTAQPLPTFVRRQVRYEHTA